ncbi:MAG TPA: hypothetical protein VGD66_06305 [Allosphingosinicella sp.]|jgi:hypothetical protein
MMTAAEIIDRSQKPTLINNAVPNGFIPQEIVYRRLGLDCRRYCFAYEMLEKPTVNGAHPEFKPIEEFTQEILASRYSTKGRDLEEIKPLDITISRHAYIVMELPAGWTFSPDAMLPGITLGGPNPDSDAYGQLRYVIKGKPPSADPVSNCSLVYFSAINRSGTPPYYQPLNFNIVIGDGVAVLVDPDIRFPGGGIS